VKGFLSGTECDYIQTKAQPSMQYSGVVLMDKDAGRPASDFRTSQTTFLGANNDEILQDIDYRTASLVRIPRNHQEPVQVLRYEETEKYSAHMDWFDPKLYQNDKNTLNLIGNGRRNRMVTVFWYLSNVEMGGETVFPRFNGRKEQSSDDCNGGLKVKPEKGKVIIFYSMKHDGTPDTNSLHGACPVKIGIKWAANKWVWNEPMRYVGS
jgi:prolyl 4-hydroxylase